MAGEGKVVPVVTSSNSQARRVTRGLAVVPRNNSYDFCPEQQIAQDPSVKDKDSPEGQEGIIRHAFL